MAFLDVSENRFPELQKVMSRELTAASPSLNLLIAEALAATALG